ncbi:glycosyltransferase family 2 protein [Paeniglutamicibacter psychrophenolicus]|uniref:glycosyltransferase family 2 protein n=1 Tax=Paeniglutamicibacter psychrophenolicus TaxID=257454 RepID=UPI0027891D5F|nr:glycosyltransferase family 2 protein [Paeniglutamicibacter psychrophenolicus]MDQ0092664.1 glycosyltransferase involved in cell wall biosynthesis [Paeniglutamicibacter psychrophenolicus]
MNNTGIAPTPGSRASDREPRPVSAVITTCGRPELLRKAVRSILDQDYPGDIEVVVVFDRIAVDALRDVAVPPGRSLKAIANTRTPGLAGGRNTGIAAAGGDVIGFCDDDDHWHRQKISRQLETWGAEPAAVAVASGIRIRTGGTDIVRLPPDRVAFGDFLRSRITALHPSTMLYRRADLLGRIGPVDEQLPAGYGEDYDLLLRATRFGDVVSTPEPLVGILWDRPSFFAGRWANISGGLSYLLRKFPEFESCPKGLARIAGQVAFAEAALGNHSAARAWARSALSRDRGQMRAYAAWAVSLGLVDAAWIVRQVQKTGRGL